MPSQSSLLVFLWWRDIGQGGTWGCGTTLEVMVFYVHEEPALRADPLPTVPVCTCLDRVEVSFAGCFKWFVRVREWAVAVLGLAAAAALAWVVVIVLALAVCAAIVIVASRPMEGGMIVGTGLSYGGLRGQGCSWRGVPSISRGGGNAPVVGVFDVSGQPCGFVVWLSRGGILEGVAEAHEGPAFVGVDRSCGGLIGTFRVGVRVSQGIPRGTGRRGRVSSKSWGPDTRYDRGRGSQST